MIFELSRPFVFLGMGIGFVVAVLVHNLAQVLTARSMGDSVTRMARRKAIEPKREFDAFGIIAVVVGGVGWGRPVAMSEQRIGSRRTRYITALLVGPLAVVLLGLAGIAAYTALAGSLATAANGEGGGTAPNAGLVILGVASAMCVSVGVLHLIPLPPLDMARVMWVLAPTSSGWQKARYNLEEQNWGLGVLVVLSLPLFGGEGLIIRMVRAMASPLISLVVEAFG